MSCARRAFIRSEVAFVVLLTSVAMLGGLMFVLASLLVVAHRKLRVEEDPRIDIVEEMLPHANCGACGFPGCRPFAEALVRGEVRPGSCTVSDDAGRSRIAEFLGVDVGFQEKVVARLACAGGSNVARARAIYRGLDSCRAAALVSGGGKGCFFGCLGLGDCELACDFDAIQMDTHGLPHVSEALCTACGDCVLACPKDLFSLHAVSHRLWVACASEQSGDEVLEECRVACTACGRCALDAPSYITMKDGLPRIDYSKSNLSREAALRCPTGAIGWIDAEFGFEVGEGASKIVRQGDRPPGST